MPCACCTQLGVTHCQCRPTSLPPAFLPARAAGGGTSHFLLSTASEAQAFDDFNGGRRSVSRRAVAWGVTPPQGPLHAWVLDGFGPPALASRAQGAAAARQGHHSPHACHLQLAQLLHSGPPFSLAPHPHVAAAQLAADFGMGRPGIRTTSNASSTGPSTGRFSVGSLPVSKGPDSTVSYS